MALLPSFFVLQSGGKYLSVTEKTPPSQLQAGFLKFDGQEIWSPRVKFAVEPSETTGLVHIRSCYNNKYLVTKQIDNNLWIVACAKKPEEDQSKDSCTLFEPYSSLLKNRKEENEGEKDEEEDTTTTTNVCLRHIQTRISATHLADGTDDIQQGVLVVSSSTTGSVFNAIDWNSQVILPTDVAFRSEELPDSYLTSVILDGYYPYQRFETGRDIGDPLVAKQLTLLSNGYYRVFDGRFGKYWNGANDWIWADAESTNTSNLTRFSFVKISDTVLALRNVGLNQFCGIVSKEGKNNVLRAEYPTLSKQTRLIVEELSLSREISDLDYRLSDSRIYGEQIQEVSNAFATNRSPNQDSTITLTYSVMDSRTTSWTNSVSVSLGVQVTFKTTIIPLIASAEVELSTEFGYSYEWGVTETREHKRESTYTVVVPPLTSVKVTLMSTHATCDVPFSYTQRDLRTNGQWVSTRKHDGVFSGANSYNFYFESHEVPLDRAYM